MNVLTNIDQNRAKNALSEISKKVQSEDNEGNALSGYPSLIINNGLIATLAFSIDKGGQQQRIADAIAYHLKEMSVIEAQSGKELLTKLCNAKTITLKAATAEALAFLSYLKRFQR